MVKQINFLYNEGGLYSRVLDSLIEPILKYLPHATKGKFLEGQINVRFFREAVPQRGVLMSHGLADKNWRDADKVAGFDYVFVSGPLWRDKMIKQGLPEKKILINGFTKLDPLFQDKNSLKNNDSKIHVLYAPTHNAKEVTGNHVSSYPRFNTYLKEIPADVELINSYHPANNSREITLDLFKSADVVISDCSSVLYEAWALGIPVVFPDWLVKDTIIKRFKGSFEDSIYSQGIGYHAQNIDELWKLVRFARDHGMDSVTKYFIEGIFPSELRGSSGKVTAEILLKLAET